jgi:YfiH family protein
MNARLEPVYSPVLDGVGHGFSTRCGGVSDAPYATLNLGLKWGDHPAAVAENLDRFAAAVGFEPEHLYRVNQVHGDRIVVVAGQTPAEVAREEADALLSREPVALGIGSADCVPILFYDEGGQIAAAHAGWRGTVKNIAGRVVHALVAGGARANGLRVAFGPCICRRCFEVGDEVAAEFSTILSAAVFREAGKKPHVDLRLANAELLCAAGVAPQNIDSTPPCTMCEGERFFSYRRDGAKTGAQLSVIFSRR